MIYPSDILPFIIIIAVGSALFVFRRKIWTYFAKYFSSAHRNISFDEAEGQGLLSGDSGYLNLLPTSFLSSSPRISFKDIKWSNTLSFTLNGNLIEIVNPDPNELLATYIRDKMFLKGTKLGCEEGGCGACSVVLEDTNGRIGAVNSCLRLLCANDGQAITTVEGIGSVKTGLSEEQQRLVGNNGTQCGYCTPGWITAMHALVKSSEATGVPLTRQDVDKKLDGNICRCTGYRPILQAFHSLCDPNGQQVACTHQDVVQANLCKTYHDLEDITGECDGHNVMLQQQGRAVSSVQNMHPHNQLVMKKPANKKYPVSQKNKVKPTFRALLPLPLHFHNVATGKHYFRPVTLEQLCAVLREFAEELEAGKVQLLGGNTSLGVLKYLNNTTPYYSPTEFPIVVDINQIVELNTTQYNETTRTLTLGATLTMNECIDALHTYGSQKPSSPSQPVNPQSIFSVTAHHLYHIANTQVRNAASWAGNFMIFLQYRDFPSDAVLAFAMAGIQLTLCDRNGNLSTMSIDAFLTTSYEAFQAQGMFIVSLAITESLPATNNATLITQAEILKVAAREHNAHAYVDGGFVYTVDRSTLPPICRSARVIYGGVGQRIFVASRVAQVLTNQPLSQAVFTQALAALMQDVIAIGINTNNGNPDYLLSTMQSFFYHSLLACYPIQTLPAKLATALLPWEKAVSRGVEVFPEGPTTTNPVGKPVRKLEAPIQATGEAVYPSDEVLPGHGVYGVMIFATQCAKTLLAIDPTAALAMDGVVAVYTAADLVGSNDLGNGNQLFVPLGSRVTHVGAPIGVLVATSEQLANKALPYIQVLYDETSATVPITTLEQAVSQRSFFSHIPQALIKLSQGDSQSALASAPYRAQGRFSAGGQSHFYMEAHTAVATLDDAKIVQIVCGTQDPAGYQATIASVLNTSTNQVVVKCPRVGGAFGGKITGGLFVSAAAAFVATQLGRPVRIFNTRTNDMNMQGGREEWMVDYDVGFTADGTITGLSYRFYLDAGSAYNDTIGALFMGNHWADNAYYFPNYTAESKVCFTNTPSRTSMRAPGVVQACLFTEMIVDRVASALQVPTYQVQQRNFITPGVTTITGQTLTDNDAACLQSVWTKVMTRSHYLQRLQAIQQYNATSLWRKQGIAICPVKYGIAWNGYNAGVRIGVRSSDGCVTVTHSGTEIGQGINTKVAQAVAMGLQIDLSLVRVEKTSTTAVVNGGVTGGSGTSEVMVQAALNACTALTTRLAPYRTSSVSGQQSTTDWITFLQSLPCDVSLNVEGWYSPTANPNQGQEFQYFVYAACVTEVAYNVLTGQMHVQACELVYDCGQSLNPAIDIGQIEGGLIMGLGYFFQEKVSYDATSGVLKSIGTWEYKPPMAQDIPTVLNVTLLANATNPNGIVGSKAVGEPPNIVINSAFFALKMALASARQDAGQSGYFDLPVPATIDVRQTTGLVSANRLVMPY